MHRTGTIVGEAYGPVPLTSTSGGKRPITLTTVSQRQWQAYLDGGGERNACHLVQDVSPAFGGSLRHFKVALRPAR